HDARLHRRGDSERPGEVVPRRFLSVLGGQPIPPGDGSGRRALAGFLTDPSNPLVARVAVNRVWQWHFGQGLVRTPNGFGARGSSPSHPELLDYLAGRLVAEGWSIKKLHRLIVLSAVYRQSSRVPLTPSPSPPKRERGEQAGDPDNVLLSHF